MKIKEVIESAIQMEQDGFEFYSNAESCTASEMGKKMYHTLAQDELKHKGFLMGMLKETTPSEKELEEPMPKERLRSLYAGLKKDACSTVRPTSDDIDALEFALGKEKESYDLYKRAAENSSDPKMKAVFERIAKEENHHYEILEETKYYLEEYENWSIWEEGGPIEGG